MAKKDLRPPWKPGESGNPAGCSRKVRERVLLRDFIHDLLPQEITDEEREELQLRVEGLTRGQLIALGILKRSMAGDAKAIDQILNTEPKLLELSGELVFPEADRETLAARIIRANQSRGNGKARGNGNGRAEADR